MPALGTTLAIAGVALPAFDFLNDLSNEPIQNRRNLAALEFGLQDRFREESFLEDIENENARLQAGIDIETSLQPLLRNIQRNEELALMDQIMRDERRTLESVQAVSRPTILEVAAAMGI